MPVPARETTRYHFRINLQRNSFRLKIYASGAPLRQVFEDLSVDLGRKPNSIRNYYYACLRNQEQNTPRVQAFIPFTEAETHDLLRQVLTGCGQGMSVRACVMRMADGDHSRMLRYQNKV